MQLLLEEFGKWVKKNTAAAEDERDAFYSLVYDAIRKVACMPLSACVLDALHCSMMHPIRQWVHAFVCQCCCCCTAMTHQPFIDQPGGQAAVWNDLDNSEHENPI